MMMRLVLAALCLLSATTILAGDEPIEHDKAPVTKTVVVEHDKAPKTEECALTVDLSTTEARLRTALFMGQTKKAAQILTTSNETFNLGAGFTYMPEHQCLLEPSDDPLHDPDVVAYQATALSAECDGDTDKLSTAIVLSFQLRCQCSLFTNNELDEMRSGFKAILDDPVERKLILQYGWTSEEPVEPPKSTVPPAVTSTTPQPTVSPVADPSQNTSTTWFVVGDSGKEDAVQSDGRRLLVTDSSPTNSLICAHCRPASGCGPAIWCQ